MVELDGFEETVADIAEQQADALGKEGIEAWVEVTNELLRNAPVGIGTGRSAGDWDLDSIADSAEIRQQRGEGGRFISAWVAEWTATTDDGIPLIEIFETGADPHIIEGDPLVFPDEETGETVFTMEVEHPGVPAVAAVRLGKNRVEMAIERGEIEA